MLIVGIVCKNGYNISSRSTRALTFVTDLNMSTSSTPNRPEFFPIDSFSRILHKCWMLGSNNLELIEKLVPLTMEITNHAYCQYCIEYR